MKKKISKVKQLEEDLFGYKLLIALMLVVFSAIAFIFYNIEYSDVNNSLQIIKKCSVLNSYNEKYKIHHIYGDHFSCRVGYYDIEDVNQLEQLKLLEIAR